MFKKLITLTAASAVCMSVNAQNHNAKFASLNNSSNSGFSIAKIIDIDPVEIIAERIEKVTLFSKNKNKQVSPEIETADYETVAMLDSAGRKTDTTEIKVGKTRIIVIGDPKIEKIYMEKDSTGDFDSSTKSYSNKKRYKKGHDGLEWSIGFNGLLEDGNTSLSGTSLSGNKQLGLNAAKSINFNLTYNKYFNIVSDNIQLSAGLGLDWNNYRFSNDISLMPKRDSLTIFRDSIGGMALNYSKNKLLARYVTVPVMLHFSTNEGKKGRRLSGAAGVELGYLINGRTKQVSNEKGKQKFNDDFNLQQLRYGYTARVTYGSVGIYGKYYPQSVFAKNEGPNLNTYCIGLTFGIE